jgi:hypothetical protein
VEPAARKLYVNMTNDIYRMVVPIDLDHDTRSCDRPVELHSALMPSNYRFVYFPCTGRAFNSQMAGAGGVVATAQAQGRIFKVYAGIRFDGKDLGRVIVVYTPPQSRPGTGAPINPASPPASPNSIRAALTHAP